MPATPKHHTDTTTQSWDGPGAEKNLKTPITKAEGNKTFAWRDPDADLKTKAAWKFPHHQVNSDGDPGDANVKGCQSGISVLNGGMGGSDIPDGDVQDVYAHLAQHLKDADVEPAPLKRSDDASGEIRAAHGPFDGTHSHPHAAFGSQGDDDTHEHEHSHDNDAKHDHPDSHRSKRSAGPPDANDVPNEIGDGDDDADDAGTIPAPGQCVGCGQMNNPGEEVCNGCGETLYTDGNIPPSVDIQSGNLNASLNSASTPDVAVVRSRMSAGAVELRDDPSVPGTGSVMYGHFSAFNDLYEIDSFFEGQFLERVAPGAYKDTIKSDLAAMRCLYDHGYDPVLGNKPLGPIRSLKEDDIGPAYEVPLLDTDYNRNFVLPCLQGRLMTGEMTGSLLGASMRFIVIEDQWDRSGKVTKDNPKGLPIRTILRTKVLEFGPVTFPANASASAGVRSGTDDFIDHLHHDQRFLARLTARSGAGVVERMLDTMRWDPGMARNTSSTSSTTTRRADGSSTRSLAQRKALAFALLNL